MKKIIYGKNKNIISTNLKIYRMKKNLSQSQLAAKMQLHFFRRHDFGDTSEVDHECEHGSTND